MQLEHSSQASQIIIAALIVAGGRGSRMHKTMPKQYLPVAGRPLLCWTLAPFLEHPRMTTVQVVIHPDDHSTYLESVTESPKLAPPIYGGPQRSDSVKLGLAALTQGPSPLPTHVLIHDGARPLVSANLINRMIDSLTEKAGLVPAIAVSDTLRRLEDNGAMVDVDRRNLYCIQTPQAFPLGLLSQAYEHFYEKHPFPATDDAAIFAWAGHAVSYMIGCPLNHKITTPEDIAVLEKIFHDDNP